MLLEQFRKVKEREICRLRQLENVGLFPFPYQGDRPSFKEALLSRRNMPVRVIAEYKRASPSRGNIAMGLTAEQVASEYAANGADCLSVLTEEIFFKGDIHYLSRMRFSELPLLRKDFIFHPLQVEATAATPASALLLIVRLTPDVRILRELRKQAESFGMDAVVEVFDEKDLYLARASGARIIQVNARDLDTLRVDRTGCLKLAERFHSDGDGEVWIAASGMERAEHLGMAAEYGFQAVLVGTTLMQGGRPGAALASLLGRKIPGGASESGSETISAYGTALEKTA